MVRPRPVNQASVEKTSVSARSVVYPRKSSPIVYVGRSTTPHQNTPERKPTTAASAANDRSQASIVLTVRHEERPSGGVSPAASTPSGTVALILGLLTAYSSRGPTTLGHARGAEESLEISHQRPRRGDPKVR